MQEINSVEGFAAIRKLANEGIILSMVLLMAPTAGVSWIHDSGEDKPTSDALREYMTVES